MNETCTESGCAAPATCEYDWGAGLRRACAGHDPLRSPYGLMVRVPMYYRTTGFPVAAAGGWLPAYDAYRSHYGGNRSITVPPAGLTMTVRTGALTVTAGGGTRYA